MDERTTDNALAEIQPPTQGAATRYQTIRRWSVVGNGRLMGSVFNRPGQGDGKTIMTSPVVQVRLVGEPPAPLAFTESGNAYWLGEPADSFGVERAKGFVDEKSRRADPPAQPDPALRTTTMKLT
ncbi:hypothetical protein HHL11_09775 [Ramlibacter sp. G-1-2-2]|uniref:Uncharacterized protein n=1 Tax=Ramlibacter agri TaxID=2728837 RepID=A0A848H0Q6_9BURK|nr:hypothetical protein [Ramlibacter agri]NML44037.1 hypothetical protein [Ramlibacter agri]